MAARSRRTGLRGAALVSSGLRLARPFSVTDCSICTNARRMLARASRSVDDSGPSRSPRPSTRQATASIANAADARSGWSADRWIAASSYRPITWFVTTTSAGTSATRRLASSMAAWASPMASAAPSATTSASSIGPPPRPVGVAPGIDVGFLSHVCYPSWGNLRRSGGNPHLATTAHRRGECVQVQRQLVTAAPGSRGRSVPVAPRVSRPSTDTTHRTGRRHPLHRSEQP